MKNQKAADIALILVTFFWGTTFVLMKQTLNSISTFNLLAIRFMLAALMVAIIFHKKLTKLDLVTIKGGSIIGLCLFSGYVFQTFGLLYTTASKSGFIAGSCVVLVPFLSPHIIGEKPGISEFSAAFVTFLGLCALTLSNGLNEINRGDVLSLLGAVAYAFQIVFISKYSKISNNYNSTFIQVLFVGILSTFFSFLFEKTTLPIQIHLWGQLLYLSLFATAIAFVVQNIAQKHTTPVRASLIFTLEPVFAAIFAFIALSERLTLLQIFGGILVVLGMLVAELNFIPRLLNRIRR